MRLALAISGYSGAGKTTLIEALLPRLAARGLRVGVLKHDTHRLTLDTPGKDTARFFDAGAAAVTAHDDGQHFVRIREAGPVPLGDVLPRMPVDLDLVLVEGHKGSPLPKIALVHPEARPPIEGPEVVATLPWGPERLALAEQAVLGWLADAWARRRLGIAWFVGGRAPLDGAPGEAEALARQIARLQPFGERILLVGASALVGAPGLPVGLPDLPGLEGPLAGLLGLLRHDPERAWLCVGRGQRQLGPDQVSWLLAARRPGRWAVLPRVRAEGPEPFGAIYEPNLLMALERAVARGTRALHRVLDDVPRLELQPPAELCAGFAHVEHARGA